MRIIRNELVRDGPGLVEMVPEKADDLWVAYNLVAEGDTLQAATQRKILKESASSRRRDAKRIRLTLEIDVEGADYDKKGCVLRVRGKNALGNEHVKKGAFHTIDIVLRQPFVLRKKLWDALTLDVLLWEAIDPCAFVDRITGVRALKNLSAMLTNNTARACYGPKHVEVAHERMAVQTLLITEELFRSCDVGTRRKYADFARAVKESGGNTLVFSSNHVSEQKLSQLTGIAAILRFPLPDLDDMEI